MKKIPSRSSQEGDEEGWSAEVLKMHSEDFAINATKTKKEGAD